jgi:hypothetical protein
MACHHPLVKRRSNLGVIFMLFLLLLVGLVFLFVLRSTDGRNTTRPVGSTLAELVKQEISNFDEPYFSTGYERPTPQELYELGLEPNPVNLTDESDPVEPKLESLAFDEALRLLVGVPIVSLDSSSVSVTVIPRGRGGKVENALCQVVTASRTGAIRLAGDGSYETDLRPKISCRGNRVEVANDGQGGFSSSWKEDLSLLWSSVAQAGADRFVVQPVGRNRAMTFDEIVKGTLGTNFSRDNAARFRQILLKPGWRELTPPSAVGFLPSGPTGVRIFSVFSTESEAEATRANFSEVLPAEDFYTRLPMGGGDVKVSRKGRVLEFLCPNLDFSGRIATTGSFPIFLVAGSPTSPMAPTPTPPPSPSP